ncbi:hypothetical protein V1291_001470 [Nitrobacteraceae bacterium AZCC 1564]
MSVAANEFAGADIVENAVGGYMIERVFLVDPRRLAANDHRKFGLVGDTSDSLRQNDRLPWPDHRPTVLHEQHRLSRWRHPTLRQRVVIIMGKAENASGMRNRRHQSNTGDRKPRGRRHPVRCDSPHDVR